MSEGAKRKATLVSWLNISTCGKIRERGTFSFKAERRRKAGNLAVRARRRIQFADKSFQEEWNRKEDSDEK